MKSVTRKALFISLIFHLFFFITTFYIVVQNQPIASEKANLAVELISAEQTTPLKPLLKKVSPRFHAPTRELIEPVSPQPSTGESLPSLAAPVPVTAEMPRPALGRSLQAEIEKEESSTSLDIAEKNLEHCQHGDSESPEPQGKFVQNGSRQPGRKQNLRCETSGAPARPTHHSGRTD